MPIAVIVRRWPAPLAPRTMVSVEFFGPMIEEQVYRACLRAVPLRSLATAVAIVAAAMA